MHASFRKIEPFRNITNTANTHASAPGFKVFRPPSNTSIQVSPQKAAELPAQSPSTAPSLSKTESETDVNRTVGPFALAPGRCRVRIGKLNPEKVASKRVICKSNKVTISFEMVNLLN